MNIYETIDYQGMKINIFYDEDYDMPNAWDNPDAFLCSDYRGLHVDSESISASECRDAANEGKWFLNGFYIFPVSIYDHSGISLSLGSSRGWDYTNGHAFVCVRRTKGWSWAKAKAEKIADGVIDEWNCALEGDVYGFVAEDAEGNEIESCWGFYGTEGREEAVSEAKDAIVSELEERTRIANEEFAAALHQHLHARKAQIRAHAPLYARTAFAY